jgi:hypothetical protein
MKTITKSKQFLVAIAALFSNTTAHKKQATPSNYDQGFRLGVGLNAGTQPKILINCIRWRCSFTT